MTTRWFKAAAVVGGAGGALIGTTAFAQEVEIRYKWVKGAVLHYRTVQDTQTQMSRMPGPGGAGGAKEEAAGSQVQESIARVEVLDVAGDGTGTLKWTIESLKVAVDQPRMGGGGGKASFDSSKPEDVQSPNPLVASYAALAGQSFTMWIDTRGFVKKVEGMKAIADKMMKNPPAGNPLQLQAMKDAFSDEAMAQQMERSFAVAPEKAVKPGDAWDSGFMQRIPMMGRAKAEGDSKLDSVSGDKIATITTTLTMSLEPPKEGEANPMVAILKPTMTDAKGEGEVQFDCKLGQLQRQMMNLTMPLVMTAPGPEGEMKITQMIKSKVIVERVDDGAKSEKAP